MNAIPGIVTGAGVPTAVIVSLVNALIALSFLALLVSIARSLRQIRRALDRLDARRDRAGERSS